MDSRSRHLIGLLVVALLPQIAASQSSCSATNDNGDQRCSISCQAGQSASCSDASGSGVPSCTCTGVSDGDPNSSAFSVLQSHVLQSDVSKKDVSNDDKPSDDDIPPPPPPSPIEITDLISVINAKLGTLSDYHLRDSCDDQLDSKCYIREYWTGIMGRTLTRRPTIYDSDDHGAKPCSHNLHAQGLSAGKWEIVDPRSFDRFCSSSFGRNS